MREYAVNPIKLSESLGIPAEERDVLLGIAFDHPYYCRCEQCAEWWKLMGPDPETGQPGPFTVEELGLNSEN